MNILYNYERWINSESPDVTFLQVATTDFCETAIDKFLAGHKEHGGSIMDRPLLKELKNEIIDAHHYTAAIDFKVKSIISILENCSRPDMEITIYNVIGMLKNL